MRLIIRAIRYNFVLFFLVLLVELGLLNIDKLLGLPNLQVTWTAVIGVPLLLVGIVFRLWASVTYFRNEIKLLAIMPQEKLIKEGPYNISRNPLYVGDISFALGLALILGSVSSVTAVVLFLFYRNLFIKHVDEKRLETAFGSEYIEYKKEVSRWLGQLRG